MDIDLSQVPYMTISKLVDFGDIGTHRIYVSMCLINHMVNGVAITREESLENMLEQLQATLDEAEDEDDFLSGIEYNNN